MVLLARSPLAALNLQVCSKLVVQKYQLRTKRKNPEREGDGGQRGMALEAIEGLMEFRGGWGEEAGGEESREVTEASLLSPHSLSRDQRRLKKQKVRCRNAHL